MFPKIIINFWKSYWLNSIIIGFQPVFDPPEGGEGVNVPHISKPTGPLGGSPGLLTSTGGLFGTSGFLMTPFISPRGLCFIAVHDSTNFDCEENGEYDFRQETPPDQMPQEGRVVTIHKIILQYREIGECKFTLNITGYQYAPVDDFVTKSVVVKITNKNKRKNFPDRRIHTIKFGFEKNPFNGVRPQASITRNANDGPYAITKLILCGNADEVPDL